MLNIFTLTKLSKKTTQQSVQQYWIDLLFQKNLGFFFFNPTVSQTIGKKVPNFTIYHNSQFCIYFFKKERFYTKLKYSRVPQFDTSSGAVASFLSGMYGFMVCEKFGFELIDSADFLFLILYVFVFFSIITNWVAMLNTRNRFLRFLITWVKSFKLRNF